MGNFHGNFFVESSNHLTQLLITLTSKTHKKALLLSFAQIVRKFLQNPDN